MKKGPTILIVDDDRMNVQLLDSILRTEGYRTLTASSGEEARRLALDMLPDLILLDIMMPGESGLDTCVTMKRDPRVSDIPIIFISAMGDVKSKVEGLGMGAVDYITKPFERLEVLARARIHLKLKLAYAAVIEGQASRLRQIRDAQQSILTVPADFPEARFAITYVPVMEAGGDFYDVFPVGEGIYGYFVADVSGHDLGASYLTSALKALISQNATPLHTPVETMRIINSVLVAIMKDSKYLTASYAHLNRARSLLTVVNAGHPPLIYLKKSGEVERLDSKGDILGAFDTIVLEPVQRVVSRGERFFLYTDGAIESFGRERKTIEEGIRALEELCVSTRHMPIASAVPEMTARLFPHRDELKDDVVLLGVEV